MLASILLALPAPSASYCSPSGDVCFGVFRRGGAISLEITTIERYFARYRLCVRPDARAATCRSFPIRRRGRLYGSAVRWYRNFPRFGARRYRVTWRLGERRLGPSLSFRVR